MTVLTRSRSGAINQTKDDEEDDMTTINAMMNTLTWMITNEEPHRKLRHQVEKIKKALGFHAAYRSGRASGKRAKRRAA